MTSSVGDGVSRAEQIVTDIVELMAMTEVDHLGGDDADFSFGVEAPGFDGFVEDLRVDFGIVVEGEDEISTLVEGLLHADVVSS